MSALAPTLQAFFTERLIKQRQASPNTIAAYRDTFRLLLTFTQQQTSTPPSQLDLADLDAELVGAFLDHLEQERLNSTATRNARLAAIRSLFGYAAHQHPEHAATIARVLAIPLKRGPKPTVAYLRDEEIDALLCAPDRSRWTGRRDHALLLTMIQTGLRVSELTGLDCDDITLTTGPHLRCHGKGRRQRVTPLTPQTAAVLRVWQHERAGLPDDPLFPTSRGRRLSRDAVAWLLAKHVTTATAGCPSIAAKTISPHTLRHYVDGWVMWPAGVFGVVGVAAGPGSGHIIPGRAGQRPEWSACPVRFAPSSLMRDSLPAPVWEATRGCGGCGEESPLCSSRSGGRFSCRQTRSATRRGG